MQIGVNSSPNSESENLLNRIKPQQTNSQNSTLASFTQQHYLINSSSVGINADNGCSKKLSPCCSKTSNRKETDNNKNIIKNAIYKKPIDLSHIV